MLHRAPTIACLLAVALSAGCRGRGPPDACGNACTVDQLCVGGACRATCGDTDECTGELLCIGGACVPAPELPGTLTISGPIAVPLAACVGFEVGFAELGATVDVATPVAVAITGSAGVYSDAACTTPVESFEIPAGDGSVVVFVHDLTEERVELSAASSGEDAWVAIEVVTSAGAPRGLALWGPRVIRTDVCTAYTLTLGDEAGLAAAADVTFTVELVAGTFAFGEYHRTPSCDESLATFDFLADSTAFTFYYRSDFPEVATLALDSPGFVAATLEVESAEVGGPPARIELSGPTSAITGRCTGYSIALLDADGNPAAVSSPLDLDLASSGAGELHEDDSCLTATAVAEVAGGTSTTRIFHRVDSPESARLSVSGEGLVADTLPVTTLPPGE